MDKREEIPQTFRDVPEEIRTKARTLAITVLNMEDVEMVTGFMAVVLLHTASQARSQAYEECAKIADGYIVSDPENAYLEPSEEWTSAFQAGARSISQAIRQHSKKGGEK